MNGSYIPAGNYRGCHSLLIMQPKPLSKQKLQTLMTSNGLPYVATAALANNQLILQTATRAAPGGSSCVRVGACRICKPPAGAIAKHYCWVNVIRKLWACSAGTGWHNPSQQNHAEVSWPSAKAASRAIAAAKALQEDNLQVAKVCSNIIVTSCSCCPCTRPMWLIGIWLEPSKSDQCIA